MGQKLGLISVLLSSAPLLILDEPMSGLDPSARIQLKDLLLDYRKNNNTIFFSSHILSDIDEICDRIAVIDKGRLVFVGTPSEFKLQFNSENLEKAFLNAINTKISENEVIETA
jgi:ABC-2 type transport system ATP-binding protein